MGRSYALLWLSQTLARFGDGFFFIAVGWLVFADTRSPLALGLLWFARRGLTAVAGTLLGPVADRVDRRRLMVGLDLGRAALTALPLGAALAGALHTWELYAVLLATAVLTTPYTPSAYAVMARIVPQAQLVRANALLAGGLEVMYLVGPALGGLFIARFGAPRSMAVDSATYVLSALLVAALPAAAGAVRAARRLERYGASLAVGWRLIRTDPTLRALATLNAVAGSTDMVFAVLMVPFVRLVLHGGAGAVGLLEASLSGGVIVASLVAARPGWRMGPLAVGLAVTAFCLATGALALAPTLAWALALQVAAGVGTGLFQIRSQALFQAMVGDDRLGRTLAARNAVLAGTQATSALAAGVAPILAGVAGAFGVFGAIGAVLSLGLSARLGRRNWPTAAGSPADAQGAPARP